MARVRNRISTADLNRLEVALRARSPDRGEKIRQALTGRDAILRYVWSDGGGLSLVVDKRSLTASYVYRYLQPGGRVRMMGLGNVLDVPLRVARELAQEKRVLRAQGTDPIDARKSAVAENKLAAARAITFSTAARDYLNIYERAKHSPKTLRNLRGWLTNWIEPVIGPLPIAKIDTPEILKVLRQPVKAADGEMLWIARPAAAPGIRELIDKILVKAGKEGYRPDTPSPARWKDHLQPILADTLKKHRVTNYLALPWKDAPDFMAALRQRTGAAARALELTLLCATRKGETLGARLSEFDLNAGMWTIPPERTKTSETHVVPLSKRAAEIVREAWPTQVKAGEDPFLWPNPDHPEKHISTEAGKNLLVRMKMHEKTTTHGLRSTFRSWCADHNINREDAERCLGHKIGNEVENVYQRSTLIRRRQPIMQQWNDFLETSKAAANVNMERAA